MANTWLRKKGVDPVVTDLSLNIDATKYTVSINGADVTVQEANEAVPKSSTKAFR